MMSEEQSIRKCEGVYLPWYHNFKMHSALLNHGKAKRAIFALNSRCKFYDLLVNMGLKRFDSLILPILLCGSEVWNPYWGGGITFPLEIKLKLKEFIYSFLKGVLEF